MSQQALSPVSFHGDTIFCTTYQNQPYTAMKPIIENMGLAWQPQARKLTACKERWSITMMVMVASDGKERDVLCMPVRKLPAFLNTINPKKVKPELRERVELYQAESDDVLWEYWTSQQKAPAVPPLSTTSDRRTLNNLVREWAALSGQSFPDCWAEIHVAFEIDAVADLPCTKVKEAEEWVRARIRDHGKPALDFKPELAVYGRKGNGEPVNLWDELKEAERILKGVAAGIALNCNSGSLSHMTPEKLLFHKILTKSANHAAANVTIAMQSVATCLSVKSEVDFFTI